MPAHFFSYNKLKETCWRFGSDESSSSGLCQRRFRLSRVRAPRDAWACFDSTAAPLPEGESGQVLLHAVSRIDPPSSRRRPSPAAVGSHFQDPRDVSRPIVRVVWPAAASGRPEIPAGPRGVSEAPLRAATPRAVNGCSRQRTHTIAARPRCIGRQLAEPRAAARAARRCRPPAAGRAGGSRSPRRSPRWSAGRSPRCAWPGITVVTQPVTRGRAPTHDHAAIRREERSMLQRRGH